MNSARRDRERAKKQRVDAARRQRRRNRSRARVGAHRHRQRVRRAHQPEGWSRKRRYTFYKLQYQRFVEKLFMKRKLPGPPSTAKQARYVRFWELQRRKSRATRMVYPRPRRGHMREQPKERVKV